MAALSLGERVPEERGQVRGYLVSGDLDETLGQVGGGEMRETKYWTWHMAAGVVILFLLGLHMLIMHVGGITHLFVPYGGEAVSKSNSLFRDGKLFFTVTYILLLGVALYHGLYGLRTILFELTLKPAVEKAITFVFLVIGLGLFGLGTWAAIATHAMAIAGARG
jgi:succinate dehydrogenase / fumarate reductase membrane anchor subunit